MQTLLRTRPYIRSKSADLDAISDGTQRSFDLLDSVANYLSLGTHPSDFYSIVKASLSQVEDELKNLPSELDKVITAPTALSRDKRSVVPIRSRITVVRVNLEDLSRKLLAGISAQSQGLSSYDPLSRLTEKLAEMRVLLQSNIQDAHLNLRMTFPAGQGSDTVGDTFEPVTAIPEPKLLNEWPESTIVSISNTNDAAKGKILSSSVSCSECMIASAFR